MSNKPNGTTRRRALRQRGAQPGNLNALKHGFYSETFRAGENEHLENAEIAEGLQDEITMMRVITRRVLQLAQGTEDLDEAMHLLNTMGMAAIRLASLLRIQKLLGANEDKVGQALTAMLTDAIEKIKEEKLRERAKK